ncbi:MULTISPECIES: hypothetical protein [Pasteurellaceae]|uniref:Uncharacterized protein n=1 Tax=Pasteurella atlantica TaxID=2827233 RepID=A0AAW8CPQ1_9PAST|nr:hypothetical protein [Pasteurella atlantica]MBR0574464.1 hypothetical protein [Pasteurella atlantica]MDP8039341.1 hypothetical protein [Pasteurella atlantica]MDP8041433.1 hypothetical protein [Pasteurella atlantica]MDP8043642.1 hypothetical protein [Pasteurella atlantica]MDP8045654.1 hypothetical protein [Pasteurella atlantica]
MVNLTQINDQFEKIPNDQRGAIVTLINIKTEDDMEKVLNRLDTIEAKFESKFDALETKFDAKFESLRWLIMALMAAIPVALTVYSYFKH